MKELGTFAVQNLIYKKRLKRMEITKGLSSGELIGRVNARPRRVKQVVQEAIKEKRVVEEKKYKRNPKPSMAP